MNQVPDSRIPALLKQLGKFPFAALAAVWRQISTRVSQLLIMLMLVVVLINLFPHLVPQWLSDIEARGEGGIVIVDSPEVYSRERLINDRFRQVNWLETN
jgi:hypothetical protein